MAIYSEQTDFNENVGLKLTDREFNIEEINSIISEFGSFSLFDVDADHSPHLETKGKLTHLMEEFETDGGVVRVYDPTSYCSDEIDEYFENYCEVSDDQIEYILEIARKWAEQNEKF